MNIKGIEFPKGLAKLQDNPGEKNDITKYLESKGISGAEFFVGADSNNDHQLVIRLNGKSTTYSVEWFMQNMETMGKEVALNVIYQKVKKDLL